MFRFLVKGLIRDRHRSLFPVLIISIGVMITVLLHSWINGVLGEILASNAKFSTGHVKIMTRAYAENINQIPNDLALMNTSRLNAYLQKNYPQINWVKRIRFGGLVDVPDSNGETKTQGPAMGLAVDLLSKNSTEIKRLNIHKSLISGRLPEHKNEILLSDDFAGKLKIKPGDKLTLIGSTMYGSMAMQNFILAGTIKFGINIMDKGALIGDISSIQNFLNMNDACGEILGYFKNDKYNDEKAKAISTAFNQHWSKQNDAFSPLMLRLMEQNDLADMWQYISSMIGFLIFIFIFAMSIVLWNAGLIGGLRRYGEVGLRLAIGENKGQVYRSMIYESIFIGFVGSFIGTVLGLSGAYLLQTKGIDVGSMLKNAAIMFPNVMRARITPPAFYIGFIPGLFSTVLGTLLSGIGIYKRQTATLFKELEN